MSKRKSVKAWRCPLCGLPMPKKVFPRPAPSAGGVTRARPSATADRVDLRRMAELQSFLAWITGRLSVREAAVGLGVDASTFSRRISWCWNVGPRIGPDGVVHHHIEADGTYLPYGRCLPVATGGDRQTRRLTHVYHSTNSLYDIFV